MLRMLRVIWISDTDEGWEVKNERIWGRLNEIERRLGIEISCGDEPEISVGFGDRAVVYAFHSQRALDEFLAMGGEDEGGYQPPPPSSPVPRPDWCDEP
jgi:hypothetical protein